MACPLLAPPRATALGPCWPSAPPLLQQADGLWPLEWEGCGQVRACPGPGGPRPGPSDVSSSERCWLCKVPKAQVYHGLRGGQRSPCTDLGGVPYLWQL